jgi:glyoxylase-like metal-dependent hydrolase (beta-lactamase superfamily II)
MEQLRDGIWVIPQPFPSRAEVFTLNYVIEDDRGGLHLIDPGADIDENIERLRSGLAAIGRSIEDVATITITHMHHDHLGVAERARAASGAAIALHASEQLAMDEDGPPRWGDLVTLDSWGVPAAAAAELAGLAVLRPAQPRIRADVLLEHDELLAVPGRELRVIHTPGHTVGHICIRGDDLLFTGDHVLPNQYPGIGLGGDRGTNPLRDMRQSLALVADLGLEVCPGHGWRFEGLAERCAQTLAHHAKRTTEVAAVLASEPDATIWEVASRLTWTAGWQNLTSFYLGSALGQTQMHMDLVRAGDA